MPFKDNIMLHASDKIRKYIKSFEALRLKAYLDPIGIWTIGWGSTYMLDSNNMIVPVNSYSVIDKPEAQKLFDYEVQIDEEDIKNYVNVRMNNNQFDSLISFVFNVGISKFRHSTLLKKLNQMDYTGAGKELLRWDKAYDKSKDKYVTLKGLTIRRQKEFEIFNTPVEFRMPLHYFDTVKAKGLMTFYRSSITKGDYVFKKIEC